MANKPKDILYVEDVLLLFKKHLNISIKRPGLYFYIQNHDFPGNTGWGRPRQWRKAAVMKWFKKQRKIK